MDSRFLAFIGVAGLLVLSPGATIAVITETAVEDGRAAALWTVLGVAIANTTLSTAAALGLSALMGRTPWMLDAVTAAGALYLGFLGARGLIRAGRSRGAAAAGPTGASPAAGRAVRRGASLGKGVATNLLNPSVALFYVMVVPQFIGPADPFLARFATLCAVHVVLAAGWHTAYAYALATMTERLARPRVRRIMEAATGLVLLGFGFRFLAGIGG